MEKVINSLIEAKDYERAAIVASYLTNQPVCFGRNIDDRVYWEALRENNDFEDLIAKAELQIQESPITISEELYLEFINKGIRVNCDREKKRQISVITNYCYAECLENKGRFIESYEASIQAVCDQRTWVGPAHDPKGDAFYGRDIILELFSCNAAYEYAMCDCLLGDRVRKEIRLLLRENIYRRIIRPYMDSLIGKHKPYGWLKRVSNWNASCLSSITSTVLVLEPNKDSRALHIALFEKYIQYYLETFDEEGYCKEELGYWGYGFGRYLCASELVRRSTKGVVDYLKTPEILRKALFPFNMEITDGLYTPVSDSSIGYKPSLTNMEYICNRVNIPYESNMSLSEIHNTEEFSSMLMMIAGGKELERINLDHLKINNEYLRTYYEQSGNLICRPYKNSEVRFGVHLKGSSNNVPHNHNDSGNFVVAVNGEMLIVDPGNPLYDSSTFSSKRYEIDTVSSLGHNVPLISGICQGPYMYKDDADNSAFHTELISKAFSDKRDEIAFDMTKLYECESLESLKRQFIYERESGGRFIVTDSFEFNNNGAYELSLITYSKVELDEKLIRIIGLNNGIEINIDAPEYSVTIEKMSGCMHTGTMELIQPIRMGIRLREQCRTGQVKLEITPM